MTRLEENQKRTHLNDSIISGGASIGGHHIELAIFDFSFMGGSMGSVVGEKIARGGPFVMNTKSEILKAVQDYQPCYI